MTRIGQTWEGANGTFTEVYYKRDSEWIGGVWDRQTNKCKYGHACNAERHAAAYARYVTKNTAGKDAKMVSD